MRQKKLASGSWRCLILIDWMDIYSLIIKHVIRTPRERTEQGITGDIAEMLEEVVYYTVQHFI